MRPRHARAHAVDAHARARAARARHLEIHGWRYDHVARLVVLDVHRRVFGGVERVFELLQLGHGLHLAQVCLVAVEHLQATAQAQRPARGAADAAHPQRARRAWPSASPATGSAPRCGGAHRLSCRAADGQRGGRRGGQQSRPKEHDGGRHAAPSARPASRLLPPQPPDARHFGPTSDTAAGGSPAGLRASPAPAPPARPSRSHHAVHSDRRGGA